MAKSRLFRPYHLVEGETYYLQERQISIPMPVLVEVTFVSYCSCPAIIIVHNDEGKQRCLRDSLFKYLPNPQNP
jgi:hypothetical protein